MKKSKSRACILMINPSSADGRLIDLTKLDYRSVDILNLYRMEGNLSTRAETEEVKI